MEIVELAKPADVWCAHCEIGRACSIYVERPPSCRDFSCQWLIDLSIPEGMRPDRSKVVLLGEEVGPGKMRLVARCDPATPVAWQREPMLSFLRRRATIGWPRGHQVIASAGGRIWVITPSGEIDLGIVKPGWGWTVSEDRNGNAHATLVRFPEVPSDG
jgi:hypothetical protein